MPAQNPVTNTSDNSEKRGLFVIDCVKFMQDMAENSIDLTVTSPLYDSLRDYQGYSFNFEEIAKNL